MKDIEVLFPLVDLQGRGIAADLLARQQEEYDEYRVGRTMRTKRRSYRLDDGLRGKQHEMLSLRRGMISDPNIPIGPQCGLP